MIKAFVILLLAWGIVPRLHRRSAAERHLLWTIALAAAAVVPLLSLILPSWQPTWAKQAMAGLSSPLGVSSTPIGDVDGRFVVRAIGIDRQPSLPEDLLWLAWVGGSVALLLLLAVQGARLWRLARSAQPLIDEDWQRAADAVARSMRLTRRAVLLQSSSVAVPVTWGLRRPVVLLPACATGWSQERAQAVLAHEFAHIGRGDWCVHVLAEIVSAVYWVNPLVWIAKHGLCREGEQAADDVVLQLGVEGSDYATHLLDIVRAVHVSERLWSPTVAMAGSDLERRFKALLSARANRGGVTRRTMVVAAALAGLCALPIAVITLSGKSPAMNVTIRTSDLPPIADAALSAQDGAVSPVRGVRVVGTAGSRTMPPEVVEYTTPPLYSDEARARGVEGIVTATAHVEADGHVSGASLVKGLGFGLDQNALVALRQWRFKPGTEDGHAVPMWTEIDIEFSLRADAVNALIANDMATRVGPGVTPPRAVRVFGLWSYQYPKHGTVVLDVVLLENGTPKIVRILQSLGPPQDEAAARNFAQWRFSPALKDGRPVKVRMNAEVKF